MRLIFEWLWGRNSFFSLFALDFIVLYCLPDGSNLKDLDMCVMGHTKFGAFPETVGIVKFLQRGQTDFSLGNSDNLLKCFVPLCSWKTTHRDDASVIFLLSSDIRIPAV